MFHSCRGKDTERIEKCLPFFRSVISVTKDDVQKEKKAGSRNLAAKFQFSVNADA